MPHLSLRLLGPFQATREGKPIQGFESNKVRALLAYLAAETDRPHPREKLAGLLWPEWPEKAARNNLRGALANLRQAIGEREAASPFLCISWQTIQLIPLQEVWVDVLSFSSLLESPHSALENLEAAVQLYRGRFLEGFSVPDSTAFEEWALLKREQYDRQTLAALHRLAAIYEGRGEYDKALPHAWRQVELEPWHEDAQRQLMRLLAANGQRSAALAQYEACQSALATELSIQPSQETIELYEQIRDGELSGILPTEKMPPVPSVDREGANSPSPEKLPTGETGSPTTQVSFRARLAKMLLPSRRTMMMGIPLLLLILAMIALAVSENLFGLDSSRTGTLPGEAKVAMVCEEIAPPQICVRYPQTGQLVQLTHDLAFEGFYPFLSWSPDGKQIVFEAMKTGDHSAIFVLDVGDPDSSTRSLGEGMFPAWSPDGAWIAFHRYGDLWIIRPDGLEAHRLSMQLCITGIAWSPDSQRIAFLEKDCGASGPAPLSLRSIRLEGGEISILYTFDKPGHGGELAWRTDGWQIACHCVLGNEEGNWLFDANGSGQPQRIDAIPISWFSNFWPQWSKR